MDASQPAWISSAATPSEGVEDEESKPVLADRATLTTGECFTQALSASGGMDFSTGSPQLGPSSKRTYVHRVYRLFKFINILMSLLLVIAQVVSVVYLPFDGIELVLKIFLSSFSVLVILNELELWEVLRSSPLLKNWIPRGYFYAFIGMVSLEENNIKPKEGSDLTTIPVDYTAAMFIETASWMMVGLGVCYVIFGLCCGQRYLYKVKDDYSERLTEQKRMFEQGSRSDSVLSGQMS